MTSDIALPISIETTSLRRVISLPWLILYGLGSTVGAGIYALTGAVAESAGYQAPLAFALAALLALCTGFSFAELSGRFPRAGGALVYVREGIGSKSLSVVVGLLSATAGVVSAATVSVGFVGYFAEILAIPKLLALCLAVGGVGALSAWGVRESVIAAGVITIVEVLGLAAILVFGVHHLSGSNPDLGLLFPSRTGPSISIGVLNATVLGFFAFLGFEDMVNVAEEVEGASSALPRAILWTLGLSTALYVSVATVAVLVVPPLELAGSSAPLSLVLSRSGGSGEMLALVALVAMLNGALVQIMMASRILFSLSRDGSLPSWLGTIHPKRRTPMRATALVSMCVALFAVTLPIESLAAATASIALAVFCLVNLSLVVLRIRESGTAAAAGLRVPIWVPVLGGIFSLTLFGIEMAHRIAPSFGFD